MEKTVTIWDRRCELHVSDSANTINDLQETFSSKITASQYINLHNTPTIISDYLLNILKYVVVALRPTVCNILVSLQEKLTMEYTLTKMQFSNEKSIRDKIKV